MKFIYTWHDLGRYAKNAAKSFLTGLIRLLWVIILLVVNIIATALNLGKNAIKKKPFATRTPSDDGEEGCKHEYIEDGVYFVEDGCKPVRFADAVCVQSPKYCNVMVSTKARPRKRHYGQNRKK